MKTILRDTRSGLFYDKNMGGFSQPDATKATTLDSKSQEAFIKAHFQKPEFIESVALIPDEELDGEPVDPPITAAPDHELDGEPVDPLYTLYPPCLSDINDAANRIADHEVTQADYELACEVAACGRSHPGYRAAIAVAYEWEKSCDYEAA